MTTRTNKAKLVAWDADFYLSQSETECFYCLTPRQIYIIGQALEQVKWQTRWSGDTSELDLDAIAGAIQEKIAMPECASIQDLILSMENLFDVVATLQATVENGGVPPPNAITVETPYYNYPNQDEPVAGIATPCATDAQKDAIYGGCVEFVNYCCDSFTDFLQVTRATGSAIPEKVDMIISAVPIYETLPLDEIFGFAAYVFEEVEEAWDALLTEDRKQEFVCALFCAILANDCTFTPELIMTVIGLQAPATLPDILAMGMRDAVAIITTGQPIGDEMFYSLIGSMLLVALAGEQFLGSRGFRPFEYRFLAGFNSPDHDWAIFCVDCPEIFWSVDYRFFEGDAMGWIADEGTFDGVFFNGHERDPDADNFSEMYLKIHKDFATPITRGIGVGYVYDAIHDCGITGQGLNLYLAGVQVFGAGSSPVAGGTQVYRADGVNNTGLEVTFDKVEIIVHTKRCNGQPAASRIHGVRLYLDTDTNNKDIMTYDVPYGTPPNGNYTQTYWKNWSVL